MAQVSGIEIILNEARETLAALGESVGTLKSIHPEVFENSELTPRLISFLSAHEEATARLQAPRLSIAMIGTTSSGKSTIVNALIGRKLAPIEAGEMSGGVLTLRYADKSSLVVRATEGAVWEVGEWNELSDGEIYDRIRNSVMLPYHDARRNLKHSISAPDVTVFGPLLPACDVDLLGLPAGVGIEFIDLPGLKSVQDQTNLSVIQERVNKSFSLVALDYMQVDDEHRKRLLEELKEVVDFLQGRTDSMIFILNRVDQKGSDDLPLSERIDKLQKEIQRELKLNEPPDILPFNARLLYYAQCARGIQTNSKTLEPNSKLRLKLLDAIFQDCAGTIRLHTRNDRELRDWFHELGNQVSDEEDVEEADLEQLLHYAYEWSGGKELWNRLRIRVQQSFPELVLVPALLQVFKSYDTLSSSIDTIASIRELEQREQVELKQQKIAESQKQLNKEVKEIREKFRRNVQEMIDLLKINTSEARSSVAQKAEEQGLQGFQTLISAINDVEGDLIQKLILPVRDALNDKNQGVYDIERTLSEVIPPYLAKDIANAYDHTSRRIGKFTATTPEVLSRKVRISSKDDNKEIKDLENDEKAVRKLYLAMRRALSTRAEFTLQAQAQHLEEALKGLTDKARDELFALCSRELPELELDRAVIADFEENSLAHLPTLPEKFFILPSNIDQKHVEYEEVTGRQKKIEYYSTGTCFKSQRSKETYQDIKEVFEYKELVLPSVKMMASNWEDGVAQGKQKLWDTLSDWMLVRLDWVSDVFIESVESIIKLANKALQEQLLILQSEFEEEIQKWTSLKRQKDSATALHMKLKQRSQSH